MLTLTLYLEVRPFILSLLLRFTAFSRLIAVRSFGKRWNTIKMSCLLSSLHNGTQQCVAKLNFLSTDAMPLEMLGTLSLDLKTGCSVAWIESIAFGHVICQSSSTENWKFVKGNTDNYKAACVNRILRQYWGSMLTTEQSCWWIGIFFLIPVIDRQSSWPTEHHFPQRHSHTASCRHACSDRYSPTHIDSHILHI